MCVAAAQNTILWTTNYYTVTGASAREIRSSLTRSRPRQVETGMDAATRWRLEWSFTTQLGPSGCRCTGFTTRTLITVILPRWTPPTNSPPDAALRAHWSRYQAGLGAHELGHAQLALAAAAELHKHVKELETLGESADCAALERRLNQAGQRVLDHYGKLEKDYDAKTRHGVTQGASFP